MFVAEDTQFSRLVFTLTDPRKDDFTGAVQEGVTYSQDADLNDWRDGAARPEITLGISPDGKHYHAFKYPARCLNADFTTVSARDFTCDFTSWADYTQRDHF